MFQYNISYDVGRAIEELHENVDIFNFTREKHEELTEDCRRYEEYANLYNGFITYRDYNEDW